MDVDNEGDLLKHNEAACRLMDIRSNLILSSRYGNHHNDVIKD